MLWDANDLCSVTRIVGRQHAFLFKDGCDPTGIQPATDLFLPRGGGDEEVPAIANLLAIAGHVARLNAVVFVAVPYFTGSNPFDADPEQMIYWPEGEKDADTLARIGLPAFTFGGCGDGLPDGCEKYLANRHVVILADNDDEGRKHADKKAALTAPVALSVRVVHFKDLPNKGDVSDWIDAGHTADDLRAFVDAAPVVEATYEPKMPHGYKFTDAGLLWLNPGEDEKPPMLIAGPFSILAQTRDGDGGSWGLLLSWMDHDGREHRYALPRAMLAGDGAEARRTLLDGGLYISPSPKARTLFNAFLLQVSIDRKARATQRVGWHSNWFVLPDDCFGADQRELLLLQSATDSKHLFRQQGTLQDWKDNVARYAVGNSRLVVAVSAAFAGPLIGPCSAESGGLHFRGASSTGKSTALFAAGSVWGGGEITGFVRSWRTTTNGLEGELRDPTGPSPPASRFRLSRRHASRWCSGASGPVRDIEGHSCACRRRRHAGQNLVARHPR